MSDPPKSDGFVSLKSMKQGPPDPASALADIRRIYFRTTAKTIDHDLAHAIDLLKSLPSEEDRERASVFMEGLAEMRREWAREKRRDPKRGSRRAGVTRTERTEGTEKADSQGGTEKQRRTESPKKR